MHNTNHQRQLRLVQLLVFVLLVLFAIGGHALESARGPSPAGVLTSSP